MASVREVVPTFANVDRLFDVLNAYLGRHGVRAIGPRIAIWHAYPTDGVDAEAAVPVEGPPPATDPNAKVRFGRLPAVESMACVTHRGDSYELGEAYVAVQSWIQANGFRVSGPNREVYLVGPESDANPAAHVTEIQFPVQPR